MTATVWTITVNRIVTMRAIQRFKGLVCTKSTPCHLEGSERFYPALSIEGTLLSLGLLSRSGDVQSLAPVGGVIPTIFRILPSSASYVALMPF